MASGKCIIPENHSSGNLKIQMNCTDQHAKFIKNKWLAVKQTATGKCWNPSDVSLNPAEGQTIDVGGKCDHSQLFGFIGK